MEKGLQSKSTNANIESRKASRGKGNIKTQLNNAIKNRPQYQIQPEAFDNQAIAKSRAFGRDRTIQMAEENVDRDLATNVGQAKNISSNTGAILDTLRSLGTGAMETKRGLAGAEAQIQGQKFGDLYNTNNAMIDERDKAWNYNVNEPYQNKIQQLRDQRKFRQDMLFKALDMAGTIGAAAVTGGGSLAAKAGADAATQLPTFNSSDIRFNPDYNEIGYNRFNRNEG